MMAKIIKLPISVQIKLGLENGPDNQYVSFSDYHHDLANVQQELIVAQEEIRRLKESLGLWTRWTNRDKRYLVEQYGQEILDDLQKAKDLLTDD